MSNINFPAIHKAYQDHLAKKGMSHVANNQVPQPQQNSPMHNLVVHAMAMMPNQEGESPQHLTIKALAEHLKRITPDVKDIHKPQTQQP